MNLPSPDLFLYDRPSLCLYFEAPTVSLHAVSFSAESQAVARLEENTFTIAGETYPYTVMVLLVILGQSSEDKGQKPKVRGQSSLPEPEME